LINNFTSFKVKALQDIRTPLLTQHPSSEIQIAKAKGIRKLPKLE
jgi:hypothetical protein